MTTAPIVAEKLFSIGSFPVTNSLLMGWIVVALTVLLAWRLNRGIGDVPGGLQGLLELCIEHVLSFMDQVTGDREKSRRFLPVAGTLFFLILACNWIGLFTLILPVYLGHGSEHIPIFRAATSDLNFTLAMALFSVIFSHIIGFFALGFFRYGNKFVKLGDIYKAFRALGKLPIGEGIVGIFTAFIEFGVGFLEMISEVAKVVSLSLRLFGNVYAGEVMLGVLATLTGWLPPFLVPVPFLFMELLVGVIQAAVFAILTLVYLTTAIDDPHGAEHHEEEVLVN